jgi:hypothetical protein
LDIVALTLVKILQVSAARKSIAAPWKVMLAVDLSLKNIGKMCKKYENPQTQLWGAKL